jgi:hypothetical protein
LPQNNLLLPLALQPIVGCGLSKNAPQFFFFFYSPHFLTPITLTSLSTFLYSFLGKTDNTFSKNNSFQLSVDIGK